MKSFNYQTGRLGEQIAKNLLIKKGYQIVASNFRTRFGEIDLIAARDNKLVFVEVKSKIGDQFGSPEEMVGRAKLKQIRRIAEVFLQNNQQIANNFPSYRIDAICLVLNQEKQLISSHHWENVGAELA